MIAIIENDKELIVFERNGKKYVYNKEYGYFYDPQHDKIVNMPENIRKELSEILYNAENMPI